MGSIDAMSKGSEKRYFATEATVKVNKQLQPLRPDYYYVLLNQISLTFIAICSCWFRLCIITITISTSQC